MKKIIVLYETESKLEKLLKGFFGLKILRKFQFDRAQTFNQFVATFWERGCVCECTNGRSQVQNLRQFETFVQAPTITEVLHGRAL